MRAFLFLISLPQIMGPDLKPYGSFKKGDIVLEINLPKEIIDVLKAHDVVLELSLEDALFLISMRGELKVKYVPTNVRILRKDLMEDKREYLSFESIEEAKVYLREIIEKYQKKGLRVQELGFNSYQIGSVQYILLANSVPKNGLAMVSNLTIAQAGIRGT